MAWEPFPGEREEQHLGRVIAQALPALPPLTRSIKAERCIRARGGRRVKFGPSLHVCALASLAPRGLSKVA